MRHDLAKTLRMTRAERKAMRMASLMLSSHLPRYIEVGVNRDRSIAYRHSLGVPCAKHKATS